MSSTMLNGILRGSVRFSTAVQRINYPMYKGLPNPSHGKFFFVGSIPMECYDQTRNNGSGGSRIYDTEESAIRAAVSAGAEVIQGADCRMIDPNEYR